MYLKSTLQIFALLSMLSALSVSSGCSLLSDVSNIPKKSHGQKKPVHTEAARNKDVSPESSQITYKVKKGDSLSKIAKKYVVSSSSLQKLNGIKDPRNLLAGTLLIIPANGVDSKASGNSPFAWPLSQLNVSSEFGARNGSHKGIDLRAPKGTSILAAASGTVVFSGIRKGYGSTVVIKHTNQVKTLYAHNHRNLVRKGQKVRKGDAIATVGKTGNATGYHVHFEYIRSKRKLNPRYYVGSLIN